MPPQSELLDARITRLNATLSRSLPSVSRAGLWKQQLLATSISQPLDQIRVLGNDADYGHNGCINAVSWAENGELLLSGGDDTTVRMWRVDPTEVEHDRPLVCTSVIHTGHSANIFGVQMLPYSTRIATCALDTQVRVSDVGHGGLTVERETPYATESANVAVIRCHSGSAKRILTEDSPDNFLTVSKDGTVRQHDLRLPSHRCRLSRYSSGQGEGCKPPLVRLHHDLSALGGSPLAPHYFVVAGEGPYGYLFDRRHAGRFIEAEWGRPMDENSMTSCVRRFGRRSRGRGERPGYEHVTGVRMARSNSHEVILSYSADGVYLYSIHDDPDEDTLAKTLDSSLISNNESENSNGSRRPSPPPLVALPEWVQHALEDDDEDSDEGFSMLDGNEGDEIQSDTTANDDEADEDMEHISHGGYRDVPIIYPRAHYEGTSNVETVKDVNFVGPFDEYIVSGSDDGNWFIWDKSTKRIHGVYKGDRDVVNVIEPHPWLPLVAVSGIDTTIKLFGPAHGSTSEYSCLEDVDTITRRNAEGSERTAASQIDFVRLLLHYRLAALGGDEEDGGCTNQ